MIQLWLRFKHTHTHTYWYTHTQLAGQQLQQSSLLKSEQKWDACLHVHTNTRCNTHPLHPLTDVWPKAVQYDSVTLSNLGTLGGFISSVCLTLSLKMSLLKWMHYKHFCTSSCTSSPPRHSSLSLCLLMLSLPHPHWRTKGMKVFFERTN